MLADSLRLVVKFSLAKQFIISISCLYGTFGESISDQDLTQSATQVEQSAYMKASLHLSDPSPN
jgi:hypothetical protein